MDFSIIEWITWFTSEQGLLSLLEKNWLIGLIIIAVIIYLETVVIFLSFLPSDSLLVTVGVFVSTLGLNEPIAIAIISLGAVVADATCFALGRSHFGKNVVRKRWLKPSHVEKTEQFYEKYGGMSIMFGRFFPILRTLTPFLAGMTNIPFIKYFMYSVSGAILWCGGLITIGMLVSRFEFVKNNIALWPLLLFGFSVCAGLLYLIRRFVLHRN